MSGTLFGSKVKSSAGPVGVSMIVEEMGSVFVEEMTQGCFHWGHLGFFGVLGLRLCSFCESMKTTSRFHLPPL